MGLFSRKNKEKKDKSAKISCENNVNDLTVVREKDVNKRLLSEQFAQEMVETLNGAETKARPRPINGQSEKKVGEDHQSNISAVRNEQRILFALTLYAGIVALIIYLVFTFFTIVLSLGAFLLLICILPFFVSGAIPYVFQIMGIVESAIGEVEQEENTLKRRFQRLFKSQEKIEQEKAARLAKKIVRKLEKLDNENLSDGNATPLGGLAAGTLINNNCS